MPTSSNTTRVARAADRAYIGTVVQWHPVVTLVRWDNGALTHIPTAALTEAK